MKGRHVKLATIPSMEEVDKERQRLEYRNRYVRVLKSTVYALVVVAAAAAGHAAAACAAGVGRQHEPDLAERGCPAAAQDR